MIDWPKKRAEWVSAGKPAVNFHYNHPLPGGKHEGRSVGIVMTVDPSYLLWMHENTMWGCVLEDNILKAVKERCAMLKEGGFIGALEALWDNFDYNGI
jgi:hypothetical protein